MYVAVVTFKSVDKLMQYENLNETCRESFHKAPLHCSLKALKRGKFQDCQK